MSHNHMTDEQRAAFIVNRDTAVKNALSQIQRSGVAPEVFANAGHAAAQATATRQASLRAQGPTGIRKADLELIHQQGLAARVELEAILSEEARVAEQSRAEAQHLADPKAARITSRVADFILRRGRR
jgi:hypothetical protein